MCETILGNSYSKMLVATSSDSSQRSLKYIGSNNYELVLLNTSSYAIDEAVVLVKTSQGDGEDCDTLIAGRVFDRGKMPGTIFWDSLPKGLDGYCPNFCQHHTYTVEVKNYDNPYHLKELFYLPNNLHSHDCSYLLMVDICSLFDRGKYAITAWNSYEKLNFPVLHILGCQSEISSIPSSIFVCVNDNLISEAQKMLGSILMNDYIKKISYEPYIKLWYNLELLFSYSSVLVIVGDGDNGYGWQLFLKMSQRNSITSYGCDLMLLGRGRMGETILWSSHSKRFNASCLILIHNIYKYTRMTDLGLVLKCAKGEEYYYCILVFAGRVIDRGRRFGLRMRSSFYGSINSAFCVFILNSRAVALSILVLRYTYDCKFVYEIVLKLGYLLEFFFSSLMVILSAEDGGSGAARKLSYKMQLQCDSLLTTNLSFQMSRQSDRMLMHKKFLIDCS
ncbi:uncharacterized protein LOC113322153 [Papaver somniferum]|uniref:uncharacterized protein LOC113322153 n=1 Tax=Papaver somniferum TaxID=3469 RepID=UPI000E6FED7C|nr:uncharacterized protein LOC113322153 [Papaver somniferum]